jgi:hypothetical protein
VRDGRELAVRLGYRLEKVRGEDVWVVRDLRHGGRAARGGRTFAEIVRWLERAERGREGQAACSSPPIKIIGWSTIAAASVTTPRPLQTDDPGDIGKDDGWHDEPRHALSRR